MVFREVVRVSDLTNKTLVRASPAAALAAQGQRRWAADCGLGSADARAATAHYRDILRGAWATTLTLLGVRFLQQAAVPDPTTNALGITMTNSMAAVVGTW